NEIKLSSCFAIQSPDIKICEAVYSFPNIENKRKKRGVEGHEPKIKHSRVVGTEPSRYAPGVGNLN
ncbi:MAG TPA: hypothetical protein PKI68_01815, partial [Pontiellaceae bacterium]|nr:hypothetical protein [Pontiellaceae bacterium]